MIGERVRSQRTRSHPIFYCGFLISSRRWSNRSLASFARRIQWALDASPPTAVIAPSGSLFVSSKPAPARLTPNEMPVAVMARLKLIRAWRKRSFMISEKRFFMDLRGLMNVGRGALLPWFHQTRKFVEDGHRQAFSCVTLMSVLR